MGQPSGGYGQTQYSTGSVGSGAGQRTQGMVQGYGMNPAQHASPAAQHTSPYPGPTVSQGCSFEGAETANVHLRSRPSNTMSTTVPASMPPSATSSYATHLSATVKSDQAISPVTHFHLAASH